MIGKSQRHLWQDRQNCRQRQSWVLSNRCDHINLGGMKPSDVEALGVILARIKALGMIQNEAEKRAKLPQGRITKWKEGKGELLLRQLTPLADVLDISIDEIAGRAAPKPQTPDEVLLWRIIRRAGAARVLQIVLDALPPAKVDGPDAADNSTSTPA